ncbi:13378_t:CDS:2 [Entrophospora sp. SA101]|nr:9947_t:CDS:2 [Entrophospora sp. SA101]CAJ0631794.1 16037_t:CDS:2 [Entrophospora sp. SA101]CAJ0768119.1 13378_t:CDS:2 [Entrophospora sp. SA101]CAJ0905811.1 1657_t:CDS:2 [Entrophospora sp. SA101]
MTKYIPLSSVNPKFEEIARGKDRIIIYNKSDLADHAFKKNVNQNILFTNAIRNKNIKAIIDAAANKVREDPIRYPYVTVMVVGMPNVGKSTIINSMRNIGVHRGKAAKTGASPGVTRNVSATSIKVLEDPLVYLIDTPEIVADYLLWRLNKFGNFSYVENYKLKGNTDDINQLLPSIAKRIGALHKQGEYDLRHAASFFIKQYRDGKFGNYTLDDVETEAINEFFNKQKNPKEIPLSKNRMKKLSLEKAKEKKLEKWRKKSFLNGGKK